MENFPLTGGQFPEGNHDAAQMYVVEVDATGATKIQVYDLLADQYVGETYFIETPSDKTSFAYSTKNRMDKTSTPMFADDAVITATKTADGSYSINFPAATDDLVVRQYEIVVTQRWGGIAFLNTHLSDYYYTPMPTEYDINVGQLTSGKTYTATVVAANAYYTPSKTLKVTFTAE
jgi:hypothetical protein